MIKQLIATLALAGILITAFLVRRSPVFAQTSQAHGPKYAGDAVSTSGWGSVENLIGPEDGNCASSSGSNRQIRSLQFNFNVPPHASILGIRVEVKAARRTSSSISVQLVKVNTPVGSAKTVTPVVKSTAGCGDTQFTSLGGSTDLWGTTWTPGDVNGSNFGVIINSGTGTSVLLVDAVRITVFTPLLRTLTVNRAGAGSGTVDGLGISCGDDCTELFNAGTHLTLLAIPGAGSTFTGWSGCVPTSDTECLVTMDANKTVTATFGVQPGTLTISKTAVGGDGTFGFTVSGPTSATPSLTTGSGSGSTSVSVAPGTYTVTETVPSGWDQTSASCSGSFTISPGQTVTCTFTNTKRGTLTISKTAVGGDGTFGFTVSGPTSATPSLTTGSGSGSTSVSVAPGTYTVTETVPSGWDQTSASCSGSFTVSAGQTVTCTFTNTKRGTLTISKTAVGGDGTFGFTVSGPTSATPSLTTGSGSGSTSVSVAPGTYTVTETVPSGWDQTSASCSGSFAVSAGQTVTCTFTNTKRGTIIVKKVTTPSPDPTNTSFTFTGNAAGSITNGQMITVNNLVPGTYTSMETVPGDFQLTSIVCNDGASATPSSGDVAAATATFKLDPGETVTCTFTNRLKQADLTVTKDDSPDPALAGQTITYTVRVTNNGPDAAINAMLSDVVPSNTTFQSITTPAGWSCSTPASGSTGTITCTMSSMTAHTMASFTIVVRVAPETPEGATITNTATVSSARFDPGPNPNAATVTTSIIARADLAISKTGPADIAAATLITYTIQVTNNGPSNAVNVTVSDPLPAGVSFVSASGSGWTISHDGTIVTATRSQLTAGSSSAITLVVRAPAIGDAIRNTVTVSSATTDPDMDNNTGVADTTLTRASLAVVAFAFRPEKGEVAAAGAAEKEGLVVVDSARHQVKVLLSKGDGTFKPGQVVLVGRGPVAAAVGDLNNDGASDVVTANLRSSDLSILEGVGDGTFKRRVKTLAVLAKPSAVVVGDFDNNSRLDIIVAYFQENAVQFLEGQGNGTFAAGRMYAVGKNPSALVAADFNQDGDLDLAVANFASGSVTVLLGRGDGTFTAGGEFAVGSGPIALVVGDFDSDGRVELVTANFKSNDLSMLKNMSEPGSNRAQRFRLIKTLAAGAGPTSLVVARFLSGSLGIAVVNLLSGELWVYLETDESALKTLQRYTVMPLPGSLAVGDYNGDGQVDLSVLGVTGESLQVLLSDSSGKFKLKP